MTITRLDIKTAMSHALSTPPLEEQFERENVCETGLGAVRGSGCSVIIQFRHFLFHGFGQHMRIDFRRPDVRMPQYFLYRFQVNTRGQHLGAGGMPQIMEAALDTACSCNFAEIV